jgi:hypothetical protein
VELLSSLVVCLVRGLFFSFYTLQGRFPRGVILENMANRLQEDNIDLSAKVHLDGSQARFG